MKQANTTVLKFLFCQVAHLKDRINLTKYRLFLKTSVVRTLRIRTTGAWAEHPLAARC